MTLTKGVDAQLRYPYDLHMRGSDYFLIEVLERVFKKNDLSFKIEKAYNLPKGILNKNYQTGNY